AASLALGGYSLTRLLQLLALAGSRRRRRSAGAELPPVRWQLFDAHSLHAVWVIAVGASIALMGLLGVWSLLDGRPSGLEPGWPLLLCGGAVALLAHLAGRRTSRCWQEADGAQQIGHRGAANCGPANRSSPADRAPLSRRPLRAARRC